MNDKSSNIEQKLLDREFSEKLQELWSAEVAEKLSIVEQKTLAFVVFKLSGEWFGLDVDCFRDVVSTREVHSVPGRKTEFLEGVVNVEGELMLKVNPNSILGLTQSTENGANGKFMLLEYDGASYVIQADEFGGVEKLSANQIIKAPALSSIEYQQALAELNNVRVTLQAVEKETEEEKDKEKNTVILGIYKKETTTSGKKKSEQNDEELLANEQTIGIIWERRFFELLKSNFKW